jgi:hypothetical protein
VTYEEGHFYRDRDGDVWQAVTDLILLYVVDRDGTLDIITNDIVPAASVERTAGPLVEVRPTGWEEVA